MKFKMRLLDYFILLIFLAVIGFAAMKVFTNPDPEFSWYRHREKDTHTQWKKTCDLSFQVLAENQ